MPQLLWDASGLAKRYIRELGSQTVNAIFAASPAPAHAITYMGYAEANAILRRNFNRGDLSFQAFQQSRTLRRTEVLLVPGFSLLTVDDTDFLNGIALTDRHNLNTSDAAILSAYLRYAQAQAMNAPVCILVASDQRLLRAADVPSFLAQSG